VKRGSGLKRGGPLKRERLRPVSPKRVSLTALRDACRKLVVELRDGNACVRCGRHGEGTRIEWSHVITRNAPSLIYKPWNSMALCGPRKYRWTCHYWFDSNKSESMKWWEQKYPERAVALLAWRHDRRRPKIDRGLELMALRQEIERWRSHEAR
jgi:hypothetical protein